MSSSGKFWAGGHVKLTATPLHWRATRRPKLAGTMNDEGRLRAVVLTESASNDTGSVALMLIWVQPPERSSWTTSEEMLWYW